MPPLLHRCRAMFENINFANVLQILSILGFGGAILVTMRNNLINLKEDVTDLKLEIKQFGDILIKMAIADNRLTNIENDVRDLRRGKGYIVEKD